jgi:hypothetical protein
MILNIELIPDFKKSLIHENYDKAVNSTGLNLYAEGICLKSTGRKPIPFDGLSLPLRANA